MNKIFSIIKISVLLLIAIEKNSILAKFSFNFKGAAVVQEINNNNKGNQIKVSKFMYL